MNDDVKILYKADLDNITVSGYFEKIKGKHPFLYQLLLQVIDEQALGIRADVLAYIADCIDDFKDDKDYALSISSLFGNSRLDPEWYKWINQFFDINCQISVGDFMVVLADAIDKDIPLQDVKCIFEAGEGDIFQVYENLEAYVPAESGNADKDKIGGNTDEDKIGNEPDESEQITVTYLDSAESPRKAQDAIHMEPMLVDMFESLATVMGASVRGNTDILNMQDDFNKVLTSLQTIVTELFRAWEKDRDTIIHLNALHNLHQQLLRSQQTKINSMRNEINRLECQIRDAERMGRKQEEINRKLSELQGIIHSPEGEMPNLKP